MRSAVLGAPTDPPRVAFAVGRSEAGAVGRNRLRRRLRAAVRDHVTLLERGRGYLVRADAAAARASYAEVSSTLRAVLANDQGISP